MLHASLNWGVGSGEGGCDGTDKGRGMGGRGGSMVGGVVSLAKIIWVKSFDNDKNLFQHINTRASAK